MLESEQVLKKLLHQIAKDNCFVNYAIDIKPISSGGANYTSYLYNATICEGENAIHMFAKVAAVGEQMRSQAPKFYETEHFFYTKLVKVYERLQDENQVPLEHRLVFSKFYGSNPTAFEETIVLENLIKVGYESFDRFKSIDWEYAKSALREMAKMHALSFAYGESDPEEYIKIVDERKMEFTQMEQMRGFFDGMFARAVQNTEEKNKDKLTRFLTNYSFDNFPEFFTWTRRPVLGHGDYRPNNLMHKINKDGSVDIKILDLQTLQGASPVVDLLYFIFTGSDEAFRAQYYEKCLDHYYTELSAAMTRLHLDPEKIYSRKDFQFEYNEKLPFGLTIAIFALPIVTVAEENAPVVSEDLDLTDFSFDKTSDLYTERLNGVVNDYVKLGLLK